MQRSALMMTLTITKADWTQHCGILTGIRYRVFVNEQGVPEALELDEHDVTASHWMACIGTNPIGTARLLDNATIGRMAVLQSYRGQGVGAALLATIITEAKRRRYPQVELGAQEHAIGFYQGAGFLPKGPRFMDAGIAHQQMYLTLP